MAERVVIVPREGTTADEVVSWLSQNFQHSGAVDAGPIARYEKRMVGGNPLVNASIAVEQSPSPTFWPGDAPGGEPGHTDHEETGPVGAGTPHARMQWFWERMRGHGKLIEDLTGWSPVSSTYRFEAAIADAFDRLAELATRGRADDT